MEGFLPGSQVGGRRYGVPVYHLSCPVALFGSDVPKQWVLEVHDMFLGGSGAHLFIKNGAVAACSRIIWPFIMNRGQAAKYNFPKRTEAVNAPEELGDEPCRQRASSNTHRISALKAVLVEDLDCAPLKRTIREHGRGLSQTRQATSKFALEESTSSVSRDEG